MTTIKQGGHDEIFLNRLSQAAAENSASLLSDARLLQEKRSFGHAFALAVLAEEELGKATILWLASLDKSATLTRDRKLVIAGRPYEPFSSHPTKQTIQLGWAFLASLLDPILKQVLPSQNGKVPSLDAAVRSVDDYLVDLTKNPERWIETLQPIIELGGLEREKQRGFYADYEDDKVLKPFDFEAKRCEQIIERVSKEIEKAKNYLGKPLPRGLEDIFLTSQDIFDNTGWFDFVKRWRARKIPEPRMEEETRKLKKKMLAALRRASDCNGPAVDSA